MRSKRHAAMPPKAPQPATPPASTEPFDHPTDVRASKERDHRFDASDPTGYVRRQFLTDAFLRFCAATTHVDLGIDSTRCNMDRAAEMAKMALGVAQRNGWMP